MDRSFTPHYGSNQLVTIAATGNQARNLEPADTTVRVINTGSGDLYIIVYSSQQGNTPVANNSGFKILAGTERYIYADYTQDRISMYSLAGTTAEVMTGTGAV